MKEIKLGNKDEYVLVDNNDYEIFKEYKWCNKGGYAYSYQLGYLHDVIMNTSKGFIVDHKNRNKLDCRRKNLRLATWQQNYGNKEFKYKSSAGYKGVAKVNGRFRARIGYDYIGSFGTAEQAARAYNKEAKKRWGIFAILNKIVKIK